MLFTIRTRDLFRPPKGKMRGVQKAWDRRVAKLRALAEGTSPRAIRAQQALQQIEREIARRDQRRGR